MGEKLMLVIERSPITMAARAVPVFTQDELVRRWVSGGEPHPPFPTRAEIIVYAQRQVVELTRIPYGWDGGTGRPVDTTIANLAVSLIGAVTRSDGLATPQFSPLPDGGVSITWLVNGDRLTIEFEDGELMFRACWGDGKDAFDYDFAPGDTTLSGRLEAALDDSRTFLEKISAGIQHQLISR
ncbi:hypothetical protein KIH27_02175 [Mycobacterium sp. M1]|uniref:Uncharacterized protein n=1 Tax=Mycolicibacter acidiphilus TaxID=2835306 RepID=A0ABS5REJ9_9MYCO|nr:hypothetical protein [Mycolicibacter acidiphilus]MBS9532392.1 hypothetical protein [Mycolicibacter acidiphilus]